MTFVDKLASTILNTNEDPELLFCTIFRFARYLHDMTHVVKIDKIMSDAKSNSYGVPQGSILGLILFNIFINDIPKIHKLPEITTSSTIYADDVQLLFSGTPNNLQQLKIYSETSLKQ